MSSLGEDGQHVALFDEDLDNASVYSTQNGLTDDG